LIALLIITAFLLTGAAGVVLHTNAQARRPRGHFSV
jgi:hypothetical protein